MLAKHIYLDDRRTPITISVEAYDRIAKFVKKHLVCEICDKAYTEDRPQVYLNTCLPCFLVVQQEDHRTTFTYAGEYRRTEKYIEYRFLDRQGYLHLSRTNSSNVSMSIEATLAHYHLHLPTEVEYKQEKIALEINNWRLRGDFVHNPVIVAEWDRRGENPLSFLFIATKGAGWSPLARRTKEDKALFTEAERWLEDHKDADGWYHHPDGSTTPYVNETTHILEVISHLLSERYQAANRLF